MKANENFLLVVKLDVSKNGETGKHGPFCGPGERAELYLAAHMYHLLLLQDGPKNQRCDQSAPTGLDTEFSTLSVTKLFQATADELHCVQTSSSYV